MKPSKSLWFAIISVAAVAFLHVLPALGVEFEPKVLLIARWWAVGALIIYGWQNNSLTTWILLSMIIGMETGYDIRNWCKSMNYNKDEITAVAKNFEIFSKVFIQLIKCVIAPLLFGTLVMGIAGQSNSKQVGRMSLKAFTYFTLATSIALVIGLIAINYSKAGVLSDDSLKSMSTPPAPLQVAATELTATVDSTKNTYKIQYHGKDMSLPETKAKQDWKAIVLHIFPENIAKMIHEGAVLQIVVFSLLFGFGLRKIPEPQRLRMLEWIESLSEVMFKVTGIIMYFAPLAVGGAMAYTICSMGFDVVGNLLKLLGTLYAALIVFILLVFIPVLLLFRIPIRQFFKAIYQPASLAFATASSEAALPMALSTMEKFGVPRKIVSFVLPTGYSFNLDGSTLYLSLASIFCAQAAGMELSWGTQLALMGTLLLTSKGVAGVPRASLVILAATVNQFNIPEWPIAIILGIDALMDMGRTSVNLMGNCLASAVVARWEGEFDDEKARNI